MESDMPKNIACFVVLMIFVSFAVWTDAVFLEASDGEPSKTADQATDKSKPAKAKSTEPETPVGFDELTLELYKKKKLFDKKSYGDLRKSYAFDFEQNHASEIVQAWGGPEEPFRKFLDEHPLIKELFFLAINPDKGGDNVPMVLILMKEIYEKYPKEFETYPALAIAVSLVWDQPERGVRFGSVMRQHKAAEPPDQAGALENFQFYSNVEKSMGDRIRFMPWEFLSLLINHKTSLSDRRWALKNYLVKRPGIGKIYGTVPYDDKMLAKTAEPRLAGVEYTLPNMLARGGVCSCQADFSTYVAKSIGAPAFSVAGDGRYGGRHAWVMWIEIQDISAQGMRCSLQSEGRYFDDHYYVGDTYEPWSSRATTDRALAMKLHSIGRDTAAYRQSILALRAFDRITAAESLTARQQLDYLGKVIELNPYSTDAWQRITTMIRNGEFEKKDANLLKKHFGIFFRTFAQHPDFTWEVFDDFISFEGWQKNRGENYGKLCSLYEQAKRPDLACKARLKYGKTLAGDGKIVEALKGLAGTCLLFPDEGAIIPEILNEMERLCLVESMEDTQANYRSLAAFYKSFVPKVPKKRSAWRSKYCVDVHERAIRVCEKINDTAATSYFQAELQKVKAGAK